MKQKEENRKVTRISTRGMPREEWLEYRRRSIGGSDAAALLGLNEYASPYALWAEKTGRVKPRDISHRESVRLGRDLEDYVAKRFTEATGKRVRRENAILYNKSYPFAHANVDRMVVGENAGLECKTSADYAIARECREGRIPTRYACQCLHYMMVTGAQRWYLAVLVFGQGFWHFAMERDQGKIAHLAKSEGAFWELVEKNTPPEPDGSASCLEAVREMAGESQPGREIDLMGVADHLEICHKLKEVQEGIERALARQQAIIMSYMGDAEQGQSRGYRVSYKTQGRAAFDRERYEKDHGPIPREYFKESKTRPLKVTKRSEKEA